MSHGTGSCVFFNDTATTEIYTLSLHDALPIYRVGVRNGTPLPTRRQSASPSGGALPAGVARDPVGVLGRSEEHTSELQSRQYLVCRLLLEKKKYDQRSSYSLFPVNHLHLSPHT